jgi:hypothetical protein
MDRVDQFNGAWRISGTGNCDARVEGLIESSMGLVLHDWDLYQAAKGKRNVR